MDLPYQAPHVVYMYTTVATEEYIVHLQSLSEAPETVEAALNDGRGMEHPFVL
jgi:hypothetical protein